MVTDPESLFRQDLSKDERIYWTGRPDASRIFGPQDLLMVPFSLMWGGFAVFWELSVLGLTPLTKAGHQNHPAPFFFALWGIPFVLVGLYIIFGRFFYKAWSRGRTAYALTNKRVLVTSSNGRQIQSLFLNQIPALNKSVRGDSSGTITFGNPGGYGNWYGEAGMGFLGRGYGQAPMAFYDIPDVERVYQMVNQLRDQAAKPG